MFARITTAAAIAAVISSTAVARDYISIAGSSTVLPFAVVRLLVRKAFVMESVQSLSISVTRLRV